MQKLTAGASDFYFGWPKLNFAISLTHCGLLHSIVIVGWCAKSLQLCDASLFTTLWTIAIQAPLFMGLSMQEYETGLPCPSPGKSSRIRDSALSLVSCIGGRVLYH